MPIEVITLPPEVDETTGSAYTLVPDIIPADVSAWDKPLATYSVSEFLLLLIAVLLIIRTVLGLFTRKWGFPEW